jgi:hypothetical protein
MTRIDMATREWHSLIGPVLPHALNDKEEPHLSVVRIEPGEQVICAVATDRYTLAAERWRLPPGQYLPDVPGPVHIRAADAAASLKLFTFSKDEDPRLKVTIDQAPVPVSVAGNPAVINHQAMTIESDDGTSLVLHDQRDPSQDPLAKWRQRLAVMWVRPLAATPALSLDSAHLAKWGKSVRKGERLTIYTGQDGAPLLVLVEDHFAGMWMQVRYLDGPEKILADSPWLAEFGELPVDLASLKGLANGGNGATP